MPPAPKERKYFRPRNWARFQHYKTRNPPWIKLYTALLDDPDFLELSNVHQAILMKLWLLFARVGRPLYCNPTYICSQLGETWRTIDSALSSLMSAGFLEFCSKDASLMLAKCLQDASAEAEPETESYTEKPKKGFEGNGIGGPEHPMPPDWSPTPQDLAYAQQKGLGPADVSGILSKMAALSAKGQKRRDWSESFRWFVDNRSGKKPMKPIGCSLK